MFWNLFIKKRKVVLPDVQLYDLDTQLENLAKAKCDECFCKYKFRPKFENILKLYKFYNKIESDYTCRDLDINFVVFNFDKLKAIFYVLKKFKSISDMPSIDSLPRVFIICQLATLADMDIDEVLTIYNKSIKSSDEFGQLSDIELEYIGKFYMLSLLNRIDDICLSLYNELKIEYYASLDCSLDTIDLYSFTEASYASGYNTNIQNTYNYNIQLKHNNNNITRLQKQNDISHYKQFILLKALLEKLFLYYEKLEVLDTEISINTICTEAPINTKVYFKNLSQYETTPIYNVLYNYNYTSIIDSSGFGSSVYKCTKLLCGDRYSGGINIYCCADGEIASVYNNAIHTSNRSCYELEIFDINISTVATVPLDMDIDMRYLSIKNTSSVAKSIDIVVDIQVGRDIELNCLEDSLELYKNGTKLAIFAVDTSVSSKIHVVGSKILVFMTLEPNSSTHLVVYLDMTLSRPKVSELKKYILEIPNNIISENILAIIPKLLYKPVEPYSLSDALKPSCNTVYYKYDSIAIFVDTLKQLKVISRLSRFNLVVEYSCELSKKLEVLASINYALSIYDISHSSYIYTHIVLYKDVDREFRSYINKHCIDIKQNVVPVSIQHSNNLNILPPRLENSIRSTVFLDTNNKNDINISDDKISFLSSYTNNLWYNHFSSNTTNLNISQIGDGILSNIYFAVDNDILNPASPNIDTNSHTICHFEPNSTTYITEACGIQSSLNISINNRDVSYKLTLKNDTDKIKSIDILYYIPFDIKTKFDIVQQNRSLAIKSENLSIDSILHSNIPIDSISTSMESFSNRFGTVVKCKDLKDIGGIKPCVAISSTIKLKPNYTKDIEYSHNRDARHRLYSDSKKSIVISEMKFPSVISHAIRWLPTSMNNDLYSIFVYMYTDKDFAKKIILDCIASGESSPYLVLAIARYCKVIGSTRFLYSSIKYQNKITKVIDYCTDLLEHMCLLDSRSLVINQQNQVSIYDSLLLVFSAQSILDYIKDSGIKSLWKNRIDDIKYSMRQYFWKNTHFGASNDRLDIRVQSLAILTGICDKTQAEILSNTLRHAMSHSTINLHNIDSVHLFNALLSSHNTDLAYNLLQSMNLISNTSNGIFNKNISPWHAYLYDSIITKMLGINISGKRVDFEPNLSTDIPTCNFKLTIENKSIYVDIHNIIYNKLNANNKHTSGDWKMSIDKIKYDLTSLNLDGAVVDKTVVLNRV